MTTRQKVTMALKRLWKSPKDRKTTGIYTGVELAQKLNTSTATVSNIISENAESDKIAAATWILFAENPILGISDKKNIETQNYLTTHNICKDAQENSRIIGISAYTGAGKTTALRAYCQKEGVHNAYYVFCDGMMSPSDLLQEIAEAMKLPLETGRKMLKKIQKKLLSLKNSLIILDEAVKLKQTTLRMVQTLYDTVQDADGSVGIVMAGVDGFEEEVLHKAKHNRKGFKELSRRVTHWEHLARPTANEAIALCHHLGLYDSYYTDYVLQGSVNAVHATDNNFGTITNLIYKCLLLISNQKQAS